jgi:hypothetical protein
MFEDSSKLVFVEEFPKDVNNRAYKKIMTTSMIKKFGLAKNVFV